MNCINILHEYYLSLNKNFKSKKEIKTNYSDIIREIISLLRTKKMKITLKNISKEYKNMHNKSISLMTVSRIMRHHMDIFYLKTVPKNPLLTENNYQFMRAVFIKVILRCVKLGIKFIFIDETGFDLKNNKFYQWREKEELIYAGATKELKNRLNLIMGIDNEKVVNYQLTYKNIDTETMKSFFEASVEKLGDKKFEYIIIMDNATYHVNESIKDFLIENKIKTITNCPYFSHFNGIEFEFRFIKRQLSGSLFKNREELKNNIIKIINSSENKNSIRKIYLKELKLYYDYALVHKNDNLDDIFIGKSPKKIKIIIFWPFIWL